MDTLVEHFMVRNVEKLMGEYYERDMLQRPAVILMMAMSVGRSGRPGRVMQSMIKYSVLMND